MKGKIKMNKKTYELIQKAIEVVEYGTEEERNDFSITVDKMYQDDKIKYEVLDTIMNILNIPVFMN